MQKSTTHAARAQSRNSLTHDPLSVGEHLEPRLGEEFKLLLKAIVSQIATRQHSVHLPCVQLPKRLLKVGLLFPIGNVDAALDQTQRTVKPRRLRRFHGGNVDVALFRVEVDADKRHGTFAANPLVRVAALADLPDRRLRRFVVFELENVDA